MIEVRFHGRGGQGAVVASNVLSLAFFKEGKCVQSFPSFGGERRGAPVMAFVRVDNEEIGIRSNVYQPDHVVVLDVSLTKTMDVTAGLKKNGWVLVNSSKPPADFSFSDQYTTATVDANNIAIRYHLGTPTSPIVNTAILGAFSKLTGLVSIDAVLAAIKEAVPDNAETNGSAAIEAYRSVKYKGKA